KYIISKGVKYMRTIGVFTTIFQFLNIVFVIGIVYVVYYLAVRLPRDLRERNAKLSNIEKILDEISRKIDK
ncbi:MAG TPA: hypothetical protein VFF25_03625, partial [Clostridia bacterium]|nr:hypothetical protein [Clostridia bacterium]